MQISLMVEGQAGLDWARWQALSARVEDWGFAGLYRSDHFTMAAPPNENSLEMIVSLAYLADHTNKIRFGPLVAPFTFREPVMLARQAAHIDSLSNGRMVLGVGAGWMKREHEMFGYSLSDTRTRMERFAEGLHIVHALLKSDTPVTFAGKFYQLKEAEVLPRPFKTRILVGGNGRQKTLRLAARYADVWNGVQLGPGAFQEHASLLDKYAGEVGREPREIQKTTSAFLFFGRDRTALEQRFTRFRGDDELRGKSLEELLSVLRFENNTIAGLADDVILQIRAYAQAGVEELMLQIFDSHDLDGLESFAEHVMPHCTESGSKGRA